MMYSRYSFLSLALILFLGPLIEAKLDLEDHASIKIFAAETSSTIVKSYQESFKGNGSQGLIATLDKYHLFGNSGDVWNSLLEYGYLTNDTQYSDIITSALLNQIGDTTAFLPKNQTKYLDRRGQSSWGLAAVTAAEINLNMPEVNMSGVKINKWTDLAKSVFDAQAEHWPITCDTKSKQPDDDWASKTIGSSGSFFLLSARLARLTGKDTYKEWAEKSFKWSQENGIIKEFIVIQSGDNDDDCSSNAKREYISNHAIYTEGAAIMFNLTKGATYWESAVLGFNQSLSAFFDQDRVSDTTCLSGRGCAKALQAKREMFPTGIASRSYGRASQAAPAVADGLKKAITASAMQSAASWKAGNNSSNENLWLEDAFNGMTAAQSLLWPQAKALTSNFLYPASPSDGSVPSSTISSTSPSASSAARRPNVPLELVAVFSVLLYML